MGVDGVIMFRRYDRDGNGVLSMEEFEPIAHRLLELNVSANVPSVIKFIIINPSTFRYPCYAWSNTKLNNIAIIFEWFSSGLVRL